MNASRRAVLGALATVAGGCLGPRQRSGMRSCLFQVDTQNDSRLGFTGDVMLGRGVNDRWDDERAARIWGGLKDELTALDGLFLNLECCISERGAPRSGRTYHFRADPSWSIPALRAAGVTWVSLANNHVLDFGPTAFEDTLEQLSNAGIAHAGAGRDRRAAIEPSVLEVGGMSIAVIGLTDRSPSYAAGMNRPGTAFIRFDVGNPTTRWLVSMALERCREADPDLIVTSLHWGPNWKTHPSETQRRFARWLIDRGVDIIHGHSAHVIQGVEVYRGRPIIYDAGDFVDDYAIKPGLHNDRSFLFEVVFEAGRLVGLQLHPIRIEGAGVQRAGSSVATWLRETMRSRSAPFDTAIERAGDGLWIPLGATCSG